MNLRRSHAAAVAVLAIAFGSLTACGGSDAGNTTCGEVKDMSADEFLDFLKDAAEDEGGDEADSLKSAIEQLEALPDESKDAASKGAAEAICEGQDDDKQLEDIEGF